MCAWCPSPSGDVVYLIVKRTIDGSTVRYIRSWRTASSRFRNTDVFFVDAGLSYSGSPTNHVSGLDHLEGEVVAVVGDGAVVSNGDPAATAPLTVSGGAITLPASYSDIHVGLAIRYPELEPLDASTCRAKRSATSGSAPAASRSWWSHRDRGFLIGPDAAHLTRYTPGGLRADHGRGDAGASSRTSRAVSRRAAGSCCGMRDPLPLSGARVRAERGDGEAERCRSLRHSWSGSRLPGTASSVAGKIRSGQRGEARRRGAGREPRSLKPNSTITTRKSRGCSRRMPSCAARGKSRLRSSARSLIGAQKAGYAAGNVDIGFGSPVDVTADSARSSASSMRC